MEIYIASSWKNEHGVNALTKLLRQNGYTVVSWIENSYGEKHGHDVAFNFEQWMKTESANSSFFFDINGAMNADLLIYYAPSGKDACVEMGAAYGASVPILGLYAKGEDLGLMRKCVSQWYSNFDSLIEGINEYRNILTGVNKN